MCVERLFLSYADIEETLFANTISKFSNKILYIDYTQKLKAGEKEKEISLVINEGRKL